MRQAHGLKPKSAGETGPGGLYGEQPVMMKGRDHLMKMRKWEKQGIETSLLGFGCMRFPTTPEGKIDEPRAEAMMDEAIAAGVNYIDTAYPYHGGESELVVGRVLQKYDRGSFYLATKLPLWAVNSLDDAKRIFAEQLKKLQTDYLDFYLLHAVSRDRWEKGKELGIVEFCEQLKAEGKIRNLGFSFHDDYTVFEEILRSHVWDFCQIQYNYMDRNEQAGDKGYALTEELGIPMVVMEPIKGGSLANFSEDINEKFHQMNPDASVASFALRWVAAHPNVKVILSGMSTEEQVRDNLKTFGSYVPMSCQERAAVEGIAEELRSCVQNGCTGCRYCMPCPVGVDIPQNFAVWNHYHMYGTYSHVKYGWENGLKEEEKAKNCIECGRCETLCPQKLSIRQDLKKVQADLDGAMCAACGK